MPAPRTATSVLLSDIEFSWRGYQRGEFHISVSPPSTGNNAPVTWEASGDNRKATAAATSSGSASRVIGLALAADCQALESSAPNSPASLRVKPGATTLAGAPDGASSMARQRTTTSSAGFAAPEPGYGKAGGSPRQAKLLMATTPACTPPGH